MRILFAAGGTAGHINPAIAVAQHLTMTVPGTECLFTATPTGMENRLVSNAGFQTTEIRIQGFKRSLSPDNLRRLLRVPAAVKRAQEILNTFQPNVIFATGGYMSFPIVWAASARHIPCILHESNAVAGMSIKLLARRADAVLLNYPSAAASLPRHCILHHVGNPLRREFHAQTHAHARRQLKIPDHAFMVLSFGGSLGAAHMNHACVEASSMLAARIPSLLWHHATGKDKYEELSRFAKEKAASQALCLHPYLDEMACYMAAADIVVSRAGAVTLTELSSLGKAAILVPYPHATHNHQSKNAEALASQGAAVVIRDYLLNGQTLTDAIETFWKSPEARKKAEVSIRKLYVPDSVEKITKIIKNII